MSQFIGFNAENKLRIPLSAYAAQIIENDYNNFSIKKATLINTIIYNYYRDADCSISLRLSEYEAELKKAFSVMESMTNEATINRLVQKKAKALKSEYAHRHNSEVNWQITLNKRVTEMLTLDRSSGEEEYYGKRPGHYVQSIMEEYALLPFFKREEIVYKDIIDPISEAIEVNYAIKVKNLNNNIITLKPYKIMPDPLSMYHYVVGIVYESSPTKNNNAAANRSDIISMRISRLTEVEKIKKITITASEEKKLKDELKNKGVQFIGGEQSTIKIRLSDRGIKKYNSRAHLRPAGKPDSEDEHIYNFSCSEDQILYYFISFGKDAKVLQPEDLAKRFKDFYTSAARLYQ